ncbi:hypothetical protein [Methanolobus sp. WCC4]|uniref:hypothetical protein n=1 Tax=Methanolobus sp. WCC4 TaxID=3125784 RepID=UPI0030FC8FF3
MKDKEVKTLVFMGGSIDIKAQGEFTNDKNEVVKYAPKIDVSTIVDHKGIIKPEIFNNMLDALSKDTDAKQAIKELASWKPN